MLKMALKESKRSVAPAEYQKYLQMKEQFDREAGIIPSAQEAVQPSFQQPSYQAPPAQTGPSSSSVVSSGSGAAQSGQADQPSMQDDDDLDDLYD